MATVKPIKEIVGLEPFDKWNITVSVIKTLCKMWFSKFHLDYWEIAKRFQLIASITSEALAPSTEVMAQVVSQMPYEPFGVSGVTDTTKFEGNLAQQYPGKQ